MRVNPSSLLKVKTSQVRANEILALRHELVEDLLLHELVTDILFDKIVAQDTCHIRQSSILILYREVILEQLLIVVRFVEG